MSDTPELKTMEFPLRGEFIPLDALLKATGIAPSGGTAKHWIAEGQVQVDGQTETRKTCKIRAGQIVQAQGQAVKLVAHFDRETTSTG